MPTPIGILLADDHALVRSALADRLAKEPDMGIRGMAGSGDEVIEQAKECRPDIILMDIDMPGVICFDAARTITAALPAVRIIFLSGFLNDWYIEQALEVKARGYLTKGESPEAVVSAIREVVAGGSYFSPEIRSRIVIDVDGATLAHKPKSRASTLTGREVEVLRYIGKGLSKKETAATMTLSVKTVDRHCANLMTKLDIHDRVDLARFAIREGLLEA